MIVSFNIDDVKGAKLKAMAEKLGIKVYMGESLVGNLLATRGVELLLAEADKQPADGAP